MTKVIASNQTVEAPVLVKCPYTGESINIRPVLYLLKEWDDQTERLDNAIFLLIEAMSKETMEFHMMEFKDSIHVLYTLRNTFGQMGGNMTYKSWVRN